MLFSHLSHWCNYGGFSFSGGACFSLVCVERRTPFARAFHHGNLTHACPFQSSVHEVGGASEPTSHTPVANNTYSVTADTNHTFSNNSAVTPANNVSFSESNTSEQEEVCTRNIWHVMPSRRLLLFNAVDCYR